MEEARTRKADGAIFSAIYNVAAAGERAFVADRDLRRISVLRMDDLGKKAAALAQAADP